MERIPVWAAAGFIGENTGAEPPVSPLHNLGLESARRRLSLLRVHPEDILASLFYVSAGVMSLFINPARRETEGGGRGEGSHIHHAANTE